jgi:hypothetical protein
MFDVFSRRSRKGQYRADTVPEKLRNKVLLLCRDVFSGTWRDQFSGGGDYTAEFWAEIHRALQYGRGRPKLSSNPQANTHADDAVHFLLTCEPQEFLDFIELIFRVDCLFHVTSDADDLVEAVNDLFRSEDAPYLLTPFVKHEENASGTPPFQGVKVLRTVAHPKVVRKDEQVTYTQAILPALAALADPAYNSANLEFRDALEDYRKGDHGDCLTKCGSAFESVMKVICEKKGWPFTPQDTAAPLLKTILSNSSLDGFFEQPLLLIATIRNRLSKAHGAGPWTRNVERHVAEYAITSTAAAILLLIHEAG